MPNVQRDDLAALVEMLQHEHFGYSDAGQKAARARKALEDALQPGGQLEIVESHADDGGLPVLADETRTVTPELWRELEALNDLPNSRAALRYAFRPSSCPELEPHRRG
jgi:hypothetical protein